MCPPPGSHLRQGARSTSRHHRVIRSKGQESWVWPQLHQTWAPGHSSPSTSGLWSSCRAQSGSWDPHGRRSGEPGRGHAVGEGGRRIRDGQKEEPTAPGCSGGLTSELQTFPHPRLLHLQDRGPGCPTPARALGLCWGPSGNRLLSWRRRCSRGTDKTRNKSQNDGGNIWPEGRCEEGKAGTWLPWCISRDPVFLLLFSRLHSLLPEIHRAQTCWAPR